MGPPGPAGPAGPQGEQGPPSPSVRVVRTDCVSNACTVECHDNEVLVSAYCGRPEIRRSSWPKEVLHAARGQPLQRPLVAVCVAAPQ